jgi:predicted flap endonuclease-1-like 5' DNA nuclease
MLKEFAEDIAGAHRAWATLSQKAVRGKSERHEVGRVSRDDLTEIPGIGAKMAKRLREVGVETFTQLARQSPENLRHELGKINRAAKVEKWITCARELAKTAK